MEHVKLIEPPCTERYARWCERSVGEIIAYLLLDWFVSRCMALCAVFGEGMAVVTIGREIRLVGAIRAEGR